MSLGELLVDWGMMLLLGVVYLLISGRLTELMLRKARAEATLRLE